MVRAVSSDGVAHATPSALPPFAHCRSLRLRMPVRKVRSALDVELIEMPRIQRSFGAGLLGCLGFPSARRWKPCSFRSPPLLWPGMSDRRAECGGSLLRCWLPPSMGSSVRQVLLRHGPMARLLQNLGTEFSDSEIRII